MLEHLKWGYQLAFVQITIWISMSCSAIEGESELSAALETAILLSEFFMI